jgi:hypothetical protein
MQKQHWFKMQETDAFNNLTAASAAVGRIPSFTLVTKRGKLEIPAVKMEDPQQARASINKGGSEESRTARAMVVLADILANHPNEFKAKPDSKNGAGAVMETEENGLFGDSNLPAYWRTAKSLMLTYYRAHGAPWLEKDGEKYLMPLKVINVALSNDKPDRTPGESLIKSVEAAIARGTSKDVVEQAMHLLGSYREAILKAEQAGDTSTVTAYESLGVIVKKGAEA